MLASCFFYSAHLADLRDLSHDRDLATALGDMVVAWSADQALVQVMHVMLGVPWKMASSGYHQIPTFES